ncbi:MAG: hypothetical protein ACR2NY_02210 [Alphaproteobacteria bacterium]
MSKKLPVVLFYHRLAFLLVVMFLLTACGGGVSSSLPSEEEGIACPNVVVLGIAQKIYRFRNNSDDPTELRFQASLGHGAGDCQLENNRRRLVVNVPVKLRVVFGPKITRRSSLVVITTLFDKRSKVVTKKSQTIKILDKNDKDIIMGQEKYFSWQNRIVTLVDNNHPPESFRITMAIKLNSHELNRVRGGDVSAPLPAGLDF